MKHMKSYRYSQIIITLVIILFLALSCKEKNNNKKNEIEAFYQEMTSLIQNTIYKIDKAKTPEQVAEILNKNFTNLASKKTYINQLMHKYPELLHYDENVQTSKTQKQFIQMSQKLGIKISIILKKYPNNKAIKNTLKKIGDLDQN